MSHSDNICGVEKTFVEYRLLYIVYQNVCQLSTSLPIWLFLLLTIYGGVYNYKLSASGTSGLPCTCVYYVIPLEVDHVNHFNDVKIV